MTLKGLWVRKGDVQGLELMRRLKGVHEDETVLLTNA